MTTTILRVLESLLVKGEMRERVIYLLKAGREYFTA
jgi:hypothetical protein